MIERNLQDACIRKEIANGSSDSKIGVQRRWGN